MWPLLYGSEIEILVLVEILLVGKTQDGWDVVGHFRCLRETENEKKLKLISIKGIQTSGLLLTLFPLKNWQTGRKLLQIQKVLFQGVWKIFRML